MFSIVCAYNNEKILSDYLLRGLKEQTSSFELIKVDNTSGTIKSAAEGLNRGGRNANGDYIIFMHQDVCLMSGEWLEKAESFLKEIPDLGVAGIAGMRKANTAAAFKVGTIPVENRVCFVYQGPEKKPKVYGDAFGGPAEAQTLDEQLLIVPRSVFAGIKFDEKTCGGWHLYGVDYSLSVKKAGLKAYVLPLPVWHLSSGSLDNEYYTTLNKILKKHRREKVICTTCGLWYTSNFLNCLNLILMAVKGGIGRWIGMNDYGAGPFIRTMKLLLGNKK
ncbi:MAG: glycosyltransferase [Candidatus Omnitrophica bacterium]|nr:glycosyltransferase [Candidatus Omnitrophota bacterium]